VAVHRAVASRRAAADRRVVADIHPRAAGAAARPEAAGAEPRAAAGVVVDVGAVMSHSVIVSRDLGIPCVVSVTDATRIIPDGAIVEIDGDTGTVSILSSALLAA